MNSSNNTRFVLQSLKLSEDGKTLVGIFLFENKSDSPIEVPGVRGLPPSTNHVFRPHYINYEVRRDGKWTRLDVGYDGVPEYFTIDPRVEYQFVINLGPYYLEHPPIQCRVLLSHFDRNGNLLATYMSDPFTLEKVEPSGIETEK